MSKYTLPFFGEIDLDSLDQDLESECEYEGRIIYLDLNFQDKLLKENRFHSANYLLQNLATIIARAEQAVKDDFKSAGVTKEYIVHHIEVISKVELAEILKNTDHGQSIESQLFSVLRLYRVGIYLDNDDCRMIMDFNLGKGVTDYIVVVYIDEKGQIEDIVMES